MFLLSFRRLRVLFAVFPTVWANVASSSPLRRGCAPLGASPMAASKEEPVTSRERESSRVESQSHQGWRDEELTRPPAIGRWCPGGEPALAIRTRPGGGGGGRRAGARVLQVRERKGGGIST